MAENPYKEDEMRKTTKKKDIKNDIIDQVYNDGTDYVPQMSALDLNDYNTQLKLSSDSDYKADLNDIKILLKSMNNNLVKILHHLNGGWD